MIVTVPRFRLPLTLGISRRRNLPLGVRAAVPRILQEI